MWVEFRGSGPLKMNERKNMPRKMKNKACAMIAAHPAHEPKPRKADMTATIKKVAG